MLHSYRGIAPRLGRHCYVADSASVVGDVELGDDVSVWYQAVLRADVHFIKVGPESNIQDGAVLHVTGGQHPCVLGRRVTVGHRAVVHGARVEDCCLVGIAAVVLDGAVVGSGSLVGAGSLVPPGLAIPPGSVVMGSPARVVRRVEQRDMARIEEGWRSYLELKSEYRDAQGGES